MKLFLYEEITGGGLLNQSAAALEKLLPEGEAMVAAVADDVAHLPEVELVVLRDERLPPFCRTTDVAKIEVIRVRTVQDRDSQFEQSVAQCDFTWVIAPEIDGRLLSLVRQAETLQTNLLNSSSTFVALASDKYRCQQTLKNAGLSVPEHHLLQMARSGCVSLPSTWKYPLVIKRCDSAGGLDMHRVDFPQTCFVNPSHQWMAESFHPGKAMSVSFLCGPQQKLPLPPTKQFFRKGTFQYAGGQVLRLNDSLEKSIATRATNLGRNAIHALEEATKIQAIGYVGVDMLINNEENPSDNLDAVVDVNPRLTTSFVGLRKLVKGNITRSLLSLVNGENTTLSFRQSGLEFSVDNSKVFLTATKNKEA